MLCDLIKLLTIGSKVSLCNLFMLEILFENSEIIFFALPSINFKRSVHGIAKVWAFRNALTIQANLGNKKSRPRPLGNFYESILT